MLLIPTREFYRRRSDLFPGMEKNKGGPLSAAHPLLIVRGTRLHVPDRWAMPTLAD